MSKKVILLIMDGWRLGKNPELSAILRKNIYYKGSTEEAMYFYVNFRGLKPIIEPLLKVRGLDGSSD